jgi:hypothetical protein
MSLAITSPSSYSTTETPTITNNNNTQQVETITPEQREILILQAINSSSNDNDNDTPTRGNNQNIGHSLNQSRATNMNTRNNYKSTPRNIAETPRNAEQNQETNNNAGHAKNIADWKALFNKAREQLPKPQEQRQQNTAVSNQQSCPSMATNLPETMQTRYPKETTSDYTFKMSTASEKAHVSGKTCCKK